MKSQKKLTITLTMLGATAILSACGGGNASSSSSGEEFESRSVQVYSTNDEGAAVPSGTAFNLLFRKGKENPYLCLEDGFAFLDTVKYVRLKDHAKYFYRYEAKDGKFVASEESGSKVTFDPSAQTIVFEDFDRFLTIADEKAAKPLALLGLSGKEKSLKTVSSTYTKGQAATIDLKPYSAIDLLVYQGKAYLPLVTFNDLFLTVTERTALSYNYERLYLVPSNSLFTDTLGIPMLTGLGESYYGGRKRDTLSQEILDLYYQETCLNFDYLYGLKKEKGYSSFASFLSQKGFQSDFANPDPKKADDALRLSLTHLVDGHTAWSLPSFFYEFGTAVTDKSRANPEREAWASGSDAFQRSRPKDTAPLGNQLEPISKSYFIAFDTFTPIDEDLLYLSDFAEPDIVKTNTGLQFASAYQYLSTAEGKANVSNVVIDLATNDGGSSDSLIYGLCTLLGEVKTHARNPLTGAINETVYKADLNLDGVIDAKDVGLVDMGYNVSILDSCYTFSSGNAFPAYAKANSGKVSTLGEKSGGGTCNVRPVLSVLGASYSHSGLTELVTKKGEGYENLEQGIPADVAIEKSSMFDRMLVGTMSSTAKK